MITDQEFKKLVLRLLLAILWCAHGAENCLATGKLLMMPNAL